MRKPFQKNADTSSAAKPAAKPKIERQKMTEELRMLYELTSKSDSTLNFWLIGSFLIPVAICAVLAFTVGPWPIWLVLGVVLGAVLTMLIFTRRAQRAAFTQVDGQPGGSVAAMGMTRGWSVEQEPIAFDPRTQDMVFRASGRGGVLLVAEGPTTRVKKLVDAERKRLGRIAPNAPVKVINVGDGDGQTPLRKLNREMSTIKRTLSKEEGLALTARLKSMGAPRPAIPRGIDPAMMQASARRMRRG